MNDQTALNRLLLSAARNGEVDQVQALAKQGADPNALVNEDCDYGAFLAEITPLMAAAGSPRSNAETIAALLIAGADPNVKSTGGVTALWYAAGGGTGYPLTEENLMDLDKEHPFRNWGGGDVDRLRLLLDSGLSPKECASNGRSAVSEACRHGDPQRLGLLIERGASVWPIAATNASNEETLRQIVGDQITRQLLKFAPSDFSVKDEVVPIFEAAKSGSLSCIEIIVENGFPPAYSSDGKNALNYATTPEVVNYLLDLGLEPLTSSFGFDAIDDAFENEDPEIGMAIIRRIKDPTKRSEALQQKLMMCSGVHMNPAALRVLLAAGADASQPSKEYGSALHYACWQGDRNGERDNEVVESAIRILVEHGADPNMLANGSTPLHEAVSGDWGSPTAVRVLLELGAKVDAQDDEGRTPLMLAASGGELECIQLLLAHGADPAPAIRSARDHLKSWTMIAREPANKAHKFLARFGLGEMEPPEETYARNQENLRQAQEALELLEDAI